MEKARIMVVEDEGVVAMQIADALKGLGYDAPVVALSGEEAVAKLASTEPDLVLMDIHLKGGISGIEVARRMRTRLDVPVVYLTAYSDQETLEQAQLTEPYGYVLKPFDERGLHAIIQMSLLKHRRSRGMRESSWWMSAVAASMTEAVVICDPKGSVKFANPACEVLLGRVRSEILESRLTEIVRLVDGDTREALTFPVSAPLLEGKSTLLSNCHLLGPEGRDVPVELSASPLRSPEGTLFGVLYVLRQISEREKVQSVMARDLQELGKAQRRVLPSRETKVPGIAFDFLSLPAGIASGDALGCFRLDDGHVGFYALDVIGEGVLSAMFSLMLHTFLSPHPDRGGILVEKICEEPRRRLLSPSEVVRELNKRFFLRDEGNPYFTIAYGVLEPSTGHTRLARAGHPFPLLQAKNGTVKAIRTEGYAVGLFPTTDVASEEVTLAPGDRLFLYSDGVVDCTNPEGVRFSSTRLVEHITAGADTTLPRLMGALRDALVSWRGSESFADDVSLICVEKE
ncbi:MAG TPA: SpoIIE family protein phosphatase [Spirochaetia bacterium]